MAKMEEAAARLSVMKYTLLFLHLIFILVLVAQVILSFIMHGINPTLFLLTIFDLNSVIQLSETLQNAHNANSSASLVLLSIAYIHELKQVKGAVHQYATVSNAQRRSPENYHPATIDNVQMYPPSHTPSTPNDPKILAPIIYCPHYSETINSFTGVLGILIGCRSTIISTALVEIVLVLLIVGSNLLSVPGLGYMFRRSSSSLCTANILLIIDQ
ncbi:hypothetical protein TYRP_000494, partial [Tyrophagus putrescentiae]